MEIYLKTFTYGTTSRQAATKVCKLKKSFYGLKQANRNWYQKITNALISFDYTQSHADYTLFFKSTDTSYTRLLIYVDDLIISGNDDGAIVDQKSHLHDVFHIKDLGKLKYFLDIEVSQSSNGIYISQRKYALDILHEFEQLDHLIPIPHYMTPPNIGSSQTLVFDNYQAKYSLLSKLSQPILGTTPHLPLYIRD